MPPFLLAFFAKPIAKWIGGGIILALAIWFAVHTWNNYKNGLIEQGRVAGYDQAEKKFNEKIAENDRTNRAVEKDLIVVISGFSKVFREQRAERVTIENRIGGDIRGQIAEKPEVFNNPACVVPKDIIEGRNQIRAMGPKVEGK